MLISDRDRLQGMEQFKDGSLEVDNLCHDLLMKARCTDHGGGVVHEKDFDQAVKSAQKKASSEV